MKDIKIRFWTKVDKKSPDECWTWTAGKSERGYGHFMTTPNHKIQAHRYSYYLHTGYMPKHDEYICHKCDNPPCVNPNHLFLGSQKDNMQDMVRKHRNADTSGENNPRAKLTKEKVNEIRSLYENGIIQAELSRLYNTPVTTISHILKNESWKQQN